ncbi:MAG: Hsp20/alpha crystallin family protein [Oscillospiraceae bacterium]|nr:Hsp20/alpha crystallin family protein [Oscillospiraceae bacterium]
MLPSIFGESLFDDWMGFPFRGLESDVDHKLYGRHAGKVMKTDLKEHEDGYELLVDLPGFKKDQIELQLQNGYLTITASKGLEEDGKDKKGKIVHQERYVGSMTRSFYIGENVKEEDVKAKFENGVLTLDFPKEKPMNLPERRRIMIEG